MATHSSILAWKNPWTEESGGLKAMGLHGWACVHEGGGRWVGSNKLVELKKKNKKHFYLFTDFWLCGATFAAWAFLQLWWVGAALELWGEGISLLRLRRLWSIRASAAVALGLSFSEACGILLDQGWNPRPPHWQGDSLPLNHHGNPSHYCFNMSFSSFFWDPKGDLAALLSLCLKLSTSFSVCFLGCLGWG